MSLSTVTDLPSYKAARDWIRGVFDEIPPYAESFAFWYARTTPSVRPVSVAWMYWVGTITAEQFEAFTSPRVWQVGRSRNVTKLRG